jgi:hypothetical protein
MISFPRELYSGRGCFSVVHSEMERQKMIEKGWVDPYDKPEKMVAMAEKKAPIAVAPKHNDSNKSGTAWASTKFRRGPGRPHKY